MIGTKTGISLEMKQFLTLFVVTVCLLCLSPVFILIDLLGGIDFIGIAKHKFRPYKPKI